MSFAMTYLPESWYYKDDNDNYFNDMNKGWYEDVGYTICIAMFACLSTPIVAVIVEKIMKKINAKKLKKVKIQITAK